MITLIDFKGVEFMCEYTVNTFEKDDQEVMEIDDLTIKLGENDLTDIFMSYDKLWQDFEEAVEAHENGKENDSNEYGY